MIRYLLLVAITAVKLPMGLPFLAAEPVPSVRTLQVSLLALLGWFVLNDLILPGWLSGWLGAASVYPTFTTSPWIVAFVLGYSAFNVMSNLSSARLSLEADFMMYLFLLVGIPNGYALAPLALCLQPLSAMLVSTVAVVAVHMAGWWSPAATWVVACAAYLAAVELQSPSVTYAGERYEFQSVERLKIPAFVFAALVVTIMPIYWMPGLHTDFRAHVDCAQLGADIYNPALWPQGEDGQMICTYPPAVYSLLRPFGVLGPWGLYLVGKLVTVGSLGLLTYKRGVTPLLFLPLLLAARVDNPTLLLTAVLSVVHQPGSKNLGVSHVASKEC